MKRLTAAEEVLLQEVISASWKLRAAMRGLSVGQVIALIRRKLRMTQRVLAHRIGIAQTGIARIESGYTRPNVATLVRIAEALGCSLLTVLAPSQDLDALLLSKARSVAEKRVDYVLGTMDLEAQGTDPNLRDAMVKAELEEVMQGRSEDLWKNFSK